MLRVIRKESAEAGGDGQDVDTKAAFCQAFADLPKMPKVGGSDVSGAPGRSAGSAGSSPVYGLHYLHGYRSNFR